MFNNRVIFCGKIHQDNKNTFRFLIVIRIDCFYLHLCTKYELTNNIIITVQWFYYFKQL